MIDARSIKYLIKLFENRLEAAGEDTTRIDWREFLDAAAKPTNPLILSREVVDFFSKLKYLSVEPFGSIKLSPEVYSTYISKFWAFATGLLSIKLLAQHIDGLDQRSIEQILKLAQIFKAQIWKYKDHDQYIVASSKVDVPEEAADLFPERDNSPENLVQEV